MKKIEPSYILMTIVFLVVIGVIVYMFYLIDLEDVKRNEFAATCEYGIWDYAAKKCTTKERYCRSQCRMMLQDLNDTWGSNTNNQDEISKSIMDCYKDCVAND